MGLDAYVRCRCWEEGRFVWTPLLEHIYVNEENRLEIDLPWDTREADVMAFDEWLVTACRHGDMGYARERIGNWRACEVFREALTGAGSAGFATLLREVPEGNGGVTTPDAARACLEELDRFEAGLRGTPAAFTALRLTVAALRAVFRAAVEVGHPVSWC